MAILPISRTLASRPLLRTSLLQRHTPSPSSPSVRPFTHAPLRPLKNRDTATDRVKKGDTLDVQSANAKAGMDAKATKTGGHATSQTDSAGGKAKAKKEFPEAPDVAIGMQDERGGKGG